MADAALKTWGHFHDWYLDRMVIGPNAEPRTLTLGLYRGDERAAIAFHGVTCLCVERFGLLNIVYGIHVVEPGDARHARASAALEAGERLTDRQAALLVFVYSTLGAELAIECDSFEVRGADDGTFESSPE
jgi:hypothetical protein